MKNNRSKLESYRVPVTYYKPGDPISWRTGDYASTMLTGRVQEIKNCKDDGIYYKVVVADNTVLDGTYYISHDSVEI